MAERGRPRKHLTTTVEDRKKYFKRYYKEHRQHEPTYMNKENLLVRLKQYVTKTAEETNAFPAKMRTRLYRFNFRMLPGSYTIPIDLCTDDNVMMHYMANITGEGDYAVCAGGAHKQSTYGKRCIWREILRYRATETPEGEMRAVAVADKMVNKRKIRLNNYWFRKKPKF